MRPIVLLVLAVLLAGCGEDDAAKEYRDEVNAICRDFDKRARSVAEPRSLEAIPDFMEKIVELGIEANEAIAAVDPPEELEDLHRRAVRAAERSEPAFRRLPEKLRGADNPADTLQREIERLRPHIEETVRLNRRLGLKNCNGSGLPGGEEQAPS